MLDPITALSLAGNVLQLIDFSIKIVSKSYRIHKSSGGVLAENEYTVLIVNDLVGVNEQLYGSLQQCGDLKALEVNERGLVQICSQCNDISNALLERLRVADPSGQYKICKSLRQALKQVWSKDEIDDLAAKLGEHRAQLNTRLLVSLRLRLDLTAIENSTQYSRLDQNGRQMLSALKQNHTALITKIDDTTQYLSNLFIGQQEETRRALRAASPLGQSPSKSDKFAAGTSSHTLIHDAIRRQDLVEIRSILKSDANSARVADEKGFTPLHVCATTNNLHIFQLLIRRGAAKGLNAETEDWSTPLHSAVQASSADVVRALLERGADATLEDLHGRTAREYITSPSEISWLFEHGCEIDAVDDTGRTALHHFAAGGDVLTVHSLLMKHPKLELKTKWGSTALLLGVWAGHYEVVEALLQHRADIEAKNDIYKSIHAAVLQEDSNMVKLLLSYGADINAKDPLNSTALELACQNGQEDIAALLLSRGADTVHNPRAGGHSLLHVVARYTSVRLITQLCATGLRDFPVPSRKNRTALIEACISGKGDVVKALLQFAPMIEHKDDEGNTALCATAQQGHVEIVKLLLDYGANTEASSSDGYTPLHLASLIGHVQVVRLLIQRKVKVESVNKQGHTALRCAVQVDNIEVAKVLLDEAHAHVNTICMYGVTPLLDAVSANHTGMVECLLAHGALANVKERGGTQYPALAIAAKHNYPDMARLLMQSDSCDVSATNLFHWSALCEAIHHRHYSIARDLILRGANVHTAQTDGGLWCPIIWASHRGSEELVTLLLEKGAKVDARSGNNRTGLSEASEAGHTGIVRRLLDAGADPNVAQTDGNHQTPLLYAATGGHEEISRLLIRAGANIHYQGLWGWSALMESSAHGHARIVTDLLEAGADSSMQVRNYWESEKWTAREFAEDRRHFEIIAILGRWEARRACAEDD